MRPVLALVLAAALGPAAAPASAQAAGWQPATTLARGQFAFGASAAQGPGGRLAVAWWRRPANGRSARIEVARAGRDARFGAPRTLDASTHSLEEPVAAYERDGRVEVVWRRYQDGNHRLTARAIGPAGQLGATRAVTGAGESAYDQHFATRAGEDPWLWWTRRTPPAYLGRFATGRLAEEQRPPGGDIFNGAAAVGPGGAVLFTWVEHGVMAAYRPPGGSFGPAVRISDATTGVLDPQPVFFGDRMGVAFAQYEAGTYRLRVATGPAGGAFGPSVALTGAGESATDPRPAGLPSGELDIAFFSRDAGARGDGHIGTPRLARVRADGQPAGALRTLDAGVTGATSLAFAASASSGAYAAWWVDGQVRAARVAPGGIAGAPRRLTSRDERAERRVSLAAGATGDDGGLVAWTTTHGAVRAARYAAR